MIEQRRIGCEPLEHLLGCSIGGRRFQSSRQLKFRGLRFMGMLRLLVVDDSPVNFGHGAHPCAHEIGEIAEPVFAGDQAFHGTLHDAQFCW